MAMTAVYKTKGIVIEGAELSPGSLAGMGHERGRIMKEHAPTDSHGDRKGAPTKEAPAGGKKMENTTAETKVLVIDDQAMIREGLRNMFLNQPGFRVIGEESNTTTAVRVAAETLPEVVIMGISGTDATTIASIREMALGPAKSKVVVILRNLKREFLEEVLRSGASAYLGKDSPFDELYRAVRAVIEGQTYITPMIAGVVIDGYLSQQTGQTTNSGLSEREVEVLRAICEGVSTREIARRLRVSVKTIETHRRRMMEKLRIFSMAELIKHAIREGITSV
jgi:two-component system, NarL family, response regulator NreC